MPPLTPAGLLAAVAEVTPSRVQDFLRHLVEVSTSAQQVGSVAPLRSFVHIWAVYVAIQRYPARAARLRHLEELVSAGVEDPTDAVGEIREIHTNAEAEAGLGPGRAAGP
ncbi:hypothetical protein GL263_24295 [Streptomyces durbertensis]|uniref:Uncharacterized protein n=2 Tax=Streptomyces durbertensis TaxID=2448886 RepID=A0ABR6EMS9_9ACTN|nr:hypothetical protein [Streptomyces durbertensis]